MMHPSHIVWLAMAIPGYAVLRRSYQEDLKSGLLGTLGLSYLATFALLSPISILCYVLHLPVATFTAACVLLIVAGMIEISRNRWWGGLWPLLVTGLSVEMLIVVVDMVMGARAGATFAGDANIHLARIRFLLDHGFNNLDPYCVVPYFYPIYHTNILHAVFASVTQLTGGEHLTVWFASLPWGKLLVASGVYYMVWAVFDRRWPAWVTAVFLVGVNGPMTFIIYPNKLAPYWLAPYMIGFAVQACRRDCSWRLCMKLAAGALVLGQTHGLYALCSAGVIAPILGVMFVIRLLRRKPDRLPLLACVLAVCLALPFPVISKLKTRAPHPSGDKARIQTAKKGGAAYLTFDNGWVMRNPRYAFGGPWLQAIFGVGVICAMVSSRRREAGVALGIVGVMAAVFYVPPICSVVLDVVGRDWILSRCGFVLRMGFLIFVPGAIAFTLEPKTRHWLLRSALSLVAFALASPYARHEKPYQWTTYCKDAAKPDTQRLQQLRYYDRVRSLLEQHIPAGQTVWATGQPALDLVMLHDAYIVASPRGSLGIPDLAQRREELIAMYHPKTPWPLRCELLRKYGIKYHFFRAKPALDWMEGRAKELGKLRFKKDKPLFIMQIDLD